MLHRLARCYGSRVDRVLGASTRSALDLGQEVAAILLEGGQVKAAGSLSRVIGVYRERTRRQNTQIALAKAS